MLGAALWGCSAAPRFTSGSGGGGAEGARTAGAAPGVHQVEGIASYYAEEFHGRKTANGETYDMHGLTAAHRTLPFNTLVRVRNLANGRTVVVRINDRGPFKDNRVIDLSLGGAQELGLVGPGTAPVELEILGPGAN